MRRISVLLAAAAILLSAVVGYTYKLRLAKEKTAHAAATPAIRNGYEAVAPIGWHYTQDDPQTGKPTVQVEAKSFEATHDPSTFELRDLGLRLFNKNADSYTFVKSDRALFDERTGILKSEGPVNIVMNVPADKNANDPQEASKRVRVTTSGVTYETKTGKAATDQLATFVFTEGDGHAVGVEYDPNTKVLHLKSQVSLDWIGKGAAENKFHIEAGDLVYKEAEQKVYLSPWSKMQRQSTTIQAQNSVVTLDDGHLRQIDSDHPAGSDERDGKRTNFSADKMTALFDDSGNLVNIVAENNARVVTEEPGSRTMLTGNRADMRFTVVNKQVNGQAAQDSELHLVLADGRAVAESVPIPQPGVQTGETRILRSEHIELEMKPGGKDVQEIRAPAQAQLEFQPNRPDQSHRIVDASHLRVVYGAGSYVDTFLAWKVATRTEKPVSDVRSAPGKGAKTGPPPPALTWSDELQAKFAPNSNQVATIEQTGHFRYEEGVRKAWANKAFLEQTINRITLSGAARVLDDTGSAIADEIVMNQANGDMDATGHVISTHEPDRNQKPGTSMLDDSKSMEAKADQMQTRENNTKVVYSGHAVMWQGANRVSADRIDIDREAESLQATGHVVSELVDNKSTANSPGSAETASAAATPPIFTIVSAPELFYRDDTRIALYSGGVKLIREKMTITSKQLRAFLTPKTQGNSDQSSLDHALADGNVVVTDVVESNRTRTGSAEHAEYYTAQNKVVLNGGAPQILDSYKGVTKGVELTYFDNDDRLIVDGAQKQLAYTKMKKK